uniref:Uncharacterized protein MANES_13G004000 n=1 Tax=Rhizophora mucronata TaxID=61149 RepID=A0A2P2KM69_RHIMU
MIEQPPKTRIFSFVKPWSDRSKKPKRKERKEGKKERSAGVGRVSAQMGPLPKSSPNFPPLPTLSLPFFLFLVSFLLPFSAQSQQQPSIYDHLRLNGLPMGLLPKGITDFSLDPSTGLFHINLSQPCNAKFENLLHYEFNVSGHLSLGKIDNLSGMSQQDLFIWLPVKSIRVDMPPSGLIHFDVGVADKQFSLSLFENPLDCTAADPGIDELPDSDASMNQPDKISFEVGPEDAGIAVS